VGVISDFVNAVISGVIGIWNSVKVCQTSEKYSQMLNIWQTIATTDS